MNTWYEQAFSWFADYYLLSTLLLGVVLLAGAWTRQPARRLALAWASVAGLALLAVLVALPGWSVVHLFGTPPSQPEPRSVRVEVQPSEPPATAPAPQSDFRLLPPYSPPPEISQGQVPAKVVPTKSAEVREASLSIWFLLPLIIGSGIVVVWLALGAWQTFRLVRGSSPPPPEVESMLAALSPSGKARPLVRLSRRVATGVALGLVRPIILLPQAYADHRDAEAIKSVLAHELAHLRGGDLWLLAALRLLMIPLWASPFYWLLRRRVRLDQETLADAAAAELTSRTTYAEQLVGWARQLDTVRPPTLAGAVGLWETKSQLRKRIAVLLDERLTILRNCSRKWKLAALTLCGVAAVALSLLTIEPGEAVAEAPAAGSAAEEKGEKTQGEGDTRESEAQPSVPTETFQVRVVDEEGAPVAGVRIKPNGLRVPNDGSWFSWGELSPALPTPKDYTTDATGVVTVEYPKYVVERRPTGVVIVRASHPEYVDDDTELQVESPNPTVVLKRGGRVEVTARLAIGTPPGKELFAIDGRWGIERWERAGPDRLRSPMMATEKTTVRVVYLPEDGPTQFSELTTVTPEVGETQSFEVELKSGTKLIGVLDDSVPRPVTGGHVVAQVEASLGNGWADWTEIAEDGTFEFDSLPPDENEVVQLVAICDGYVSTPPGGWTDETTRTAPQTANLGGKEVRHTMTMTPTAKALLRFENKSGEPIVGVELGFAPNVSWRGGGSSIVAYPRVSSRLMLLTGKSFVESMREETSPYSATTDAEGVATLLNLPPGDGCMLFATHDNYQMPATLSPGQATRIQTLDLKSGAFAEATYVMEPKGRTQLTADGEVVADDAETETAGDPTKLSGVVLGPDDKPLAGVDVDAWTWYPGNETKTDAEGRFELSGFEPNGHIELEFTKEDYCPTYVVSKQAGSQGWVVRMRNDTWLEGQVLDQDGAPVSDVEIRAERGPFENPNGVIGEVKTTTTSDSAGNYKLYLEPDDYTLIARTAEGLVLRRESVRLEEGQPRKMALELEQGITFRAKIVDSITGEPVEGITLWNWRYENIEGTSNADGLLEVPGMFPSNFEFNVTAQGVNRRRERVAGEYARWWSEQAVNEHQRKQVEPATFQRNFDSLEFKLATAMDPVTIFVEPCAVVRGRVLDPEGNPVAGATVAPAKTGSGNSITGDTRYSYTTDDDGTFEAKLPASGGVVYNLVAHDGAHREWRNWANGVGEPFITSPGQVVEDVELQLTKGATVRGMLLNAAGKPLALQQVRAVPADELVNRYYVPTVRTDAEGRFELKHIRPGKTIIEAEPFWMNPMDGLADKRTTLELDSSEVKEGVTLGPADTKSVSTPADSSDFVLEVAGDREVEASAPAPPVSIHVRDSGGNPVSQAYVTLWRALEPTDAEPVNRVNGPNGFGYYDPVVWHDEQHDARWVRERSAHPNDGRHSKEGVAEYHVRDLRPGRYRVIVASYRSNVQTPDPSPYGVSEPFTFDGSTPQSVTVRLLPEEASLTVRAVDAQSNEPIARMALRLRADDGMPIVHGHGTGNFFERTDDNGTVQFAHLPQGEYTVQVLGKQAQVNNFVQYEPVAEWTNVRVEAGANSVDITIEPRELDRAEIDQRFPFSVYGQVTDEQGNPVANAEVRAATGMGTLLGGGRVTTDQDGNYRLYFGPGMHTQISEHAPKGVGVQAAQFYVSKPGWKLNVEEGYLFYLMTDQTPEQFADLLKAEGGEYWGKKSADEVVFAGQPRELDFVVLKDREASEQNSPERESEQETEAKRTDLTVVIAKNLMLLGGTELITWQGLEDRIARLPDPSQAHVHYRMTGGAIKQGAEDLRKAEHNRLTEKFGLRGYSIGGLSGRGSHRFDKLETVVDLMPDPDHATTGRVVDSDGQPVAEVQVVFVPPVDEALSYKTIDLYVLDGQLRRHLDDVVVSTDQNGAFTVFPESADLKYYLIAMHPEHGFAAARRQGRDLSEPIELEPWASIKSTILPQEGMEQRASLSTNIAADDGWPELTINTQIPDRRPKPKAGEFHFPCVPPNLQTYYRRGIIKEQGTSISLPTQELRLDPGEVRELTIGGLTPDEADRLELHERLMEERRQRAGQSAPDAGGP